VFLHSSASIRVSVHAELPSNKRASEQLLHRGGQFVPPKIRAFIDYMRGALDLRGR